VTGRQVRNFRETIRANGWLVTEPVEYGGNEQAVRLRRLLSYAVAEGQNVLTIKAHVLVLLKTTGLSVFQEILSHKDFR